MKDNRMQVSAGIMGIGMMLIIQALGCSADSKVQNEPGSTQIGPEGGEERLVFKEPIEVKPSGRFWFPDSDAESSGPPTLVVSNHYEVCDSDLWQLSKELQKEVLATGVLKSNIVIDLPNGAFADNSGGTIESQVYKDNLRIVTRVAGPHKGFLPDGWLMVVAQVRVFWGEEKELSALNYIAEVKINVRRDDEKRGLWVLYWISSRSTHPDAERANDDVGRAIWTPDLFSDGRTEVEIAEP